MPQLRCLVLPRKVTKRSCPRFAAPLGFPRYFANKRGCATRPSRAHKTCPAAELGQCSPNLRLFAKYRGGAQGKEDQRRFCVGSAHSSFFLNRWVLCAHLKSLWFWVFALHSPHPPPSSGGGSGNSDEYV